MRTTDNNGGRSINDFQNLNIEDISFLANKNLVDLQKENSDLLIFPQTLGKYHDDIEKSHIFSLDEEKLTTNNIMGFVGRNSTQFTISSRFAKDDNNDYFLHYMLQKIFSLNILKFDQTPNKENIWDFLLYLFPFYLKKAYSQGMYKAYRKKDYNDINLKGTIDIKRHISKNIPFTGRIAYTTKEYSYDNSITQLIKHTIEHIKQHRYANGLLTTDVEVRNIVNKFNFVTQNTYSKNLRQKIISLNLRPVSHPYYTEYRMLQQICLKILRTERLTFGNEKDKVYGLLFDGSWLWEEYLSVLLKEEFIHPENKTGKNRYYLFENSQPIYPDFISKNEPKIIGDAKYIPLDRQNSYSESSERAISIYYKTISYMYRFSSEYGVLIFPHKDSSFTKINKIKETNGIIKKIGLAIPQYADNFIDFKKIMCENEKDMKENLLSIADIIL